jgi:hypothetical protein
MNIKDALIPTGKAIPVNDDCGGYVTIFEDDLYWFNYGTNEKTFRVSIHPIMNTEWLPYVEDEKIRPEDAEEMWEKDGNKYFTVKYCVDDICFVDGNNKELGSDVIHGKNGWTRLCPAVEESMKEYADRVLENMEPEFPFWVKITDCSNDNFWYKDKIGRAYRIIGIEDIEYGWGFEDKNRYIVDDEVSLIVVDDCEKVERG